jgi:RNA polymerase sigma-70 factor, ECF subfamily
MAARAADGVLVARARDGSREAAGELFVRHWPGAWRAAFALTGRRALADDVAQDAFERAFAALARFDERRAFAPWLHRIVVNRALDLMRAERRLVGLDGAGELAACEVPEPLDRELLAAVAALSVERRAVIVLRHLLGYAPPEIAELLGVPVGTVHSRLARALADLRAQLGVANA